MRSQPLASSFNSSILLILIVLFVDSAAANVCPIPGAGSVHRNKTCPDFKADPSFTFCCTSKLPLSSVVYKDRHGVFCCSEEDFQKEQQEVADEELRKFIKNYLAVIILCSLIGICLSIVLISIVCKRIKRCPLYRNPSGLSHPAQPTSMYRPVDTIPPKIYEAPPPYECFVPPPDQGRNDWNCVLENEVNGSRRTAPLT